MNYYTAKRRDYNWVRYLTLVMLGAAIGMGLAILAIFLATLDGPAVYTYDDFVRISAVDCNYLGCGRAVI